MSSIITSTGINEIWTCAQKFFQVMTENGDLERARATQRYSWMWTDLQEELLARIYADDGLKTALNNIEGELWSNEITPRFAARQLVEQFLSRGHPTPSSSSTPKPSTPVPPKT